uniref:Uncharacterized protein n=1 Tax=Glycine max TaxID=3847 RepID=C6TCH1_SOYBN|nr:unknown [Glycine max]
MMLVIFFQYQVLHLSFTLYPSVEKASGPIGIARISAMLSIPLLQSYSFIALLSGLALYIVLSIASILKNILSINLVTKANGCFISPRHPYGLLCLEHS